MNPTISTRLAFTVVGLRLRTRPMSAEIPALWERFVPRMDEVQPQAEPGVSYGVMGNYDEQSGAFDYLAGMAVSELGEMPEGMSNWVVPANTYAVFETNLNNLQKTMDAIYRDWLPFSGYQAAQGLTFERYPATYAGPESTFTVYVPVRKRE